MLVYIGGKTFPLWLTTSWKFQPSKRLGCRFFLKTWIFFGAAGYPPFFASPGNTSGRFFLGKAWIYFRMVVENNSLELGLIFLRGVKTVAWKGGILRVSFTLNMGKWSDPRKSKDETLPLGSRESFIWIIPKTILCLVLDFQGDYTHI